MSLIGESIMLSILERGENAAVTKAAVFFLFLFLAFYACFMSVVTQFTAGEWPCFSADVLIAMPPLSFILQSSGLPPSELEASHCRHRLYSCRHWLY
jgi:hypothetical protein